MKRINALYDIDWDATENSHGEIWYTNPPDSIQSWLETDHDRDNNVTLHQEPQIAVHPYISSLEMVCTLLEHQAT